MRPNEKIGKWYHYNIYRNGFAGFTKTLRAADPKSGLYLVHGYMHRCYSKQYVGLEGLGLHKEGGEHDSLDNSFQTPRGRCVIEYANGMLTGRWWQIVLKEKADDKI